MGSPARRDVQPGFTRHASDNIIIVRGFVTVSPQGLGEHWSAGLRSRTLYHTSDLVELFNDLAVLEPDACNSCVIHGKTWCCMRLRSAKWHAFGGSTSGLCFRLALKYLLRTPASPLNGERSEFRRCYELHRHDANSRRR